MNRYSIHACIYVIYLYVLRMCSLLYLFIILIYTIRIIYRLVTGCHPLKPKLIPGWLSTIPPQIDNRHSKDMNSAIIIYNIHILVCSSIILLRLTAHVTYILFRMTGVDYVTLPIHT